MGGSRRRYSDELRKQVVDLARAGHRPASLARTFEPSERTIRLWVRQAELDVRSGSGRMTTEVRREMLRMKRENRRLRLERDILKRAVAWFAAGNEPAETRQTHVRQSAGNADALSEGLDS